MMARSSPFNSYWNNSNGSVGNDGTRLDIHEGPLGNLIAGFTLFYHAEYYFNGGNVGALVLWSTDHSPDSREFVPKLSLKNGNGDSTAILETFSPIESVSIFTQVLSVNELSYDGVDIPLLFNK
ncbi:hypothetical protein Tco_0939887 [Tanacetum coccineum]|uniref:Uncharacterized protein n=1 Tax=Tanacetum coccineum TaxID=301880 RepID=A0ABQ5DNQ9_9ASTR